jgi:hypothetical protein
MFVICERKNIFQNLGHFLLRRVIEKVTKERNNKKTFAILVFQNFAF